jgi:hypothetical protein
MIILTDKYAEGPADLNEAEPNSFMGFVNFVSWDLHRLKHAGATKAHYQHEDWIALAHSFPHGWEVKSFSISNLSQSKQ